MSPMATRSVGGHAVMFLLFSLTGASTSLFDEKKADLCQRLLVAPVRRTHILWSKYIFGILLGVVKLVTLFVAGRFSSGSNITSNVFNLLLICLAAAVRALSSACCSPRSRRRPRSAIDFNGRPIWIADAHHDDGRRFVVARVLVRFDHVARFIVNTNHSIV